MINPYQKKILLLAVHAGEIMLKNGAETSRVEDTITRICKACRIDRIETFATPTGIFISLDKGGENDDTQTFIKRIRGTTTDLNKVSKINSFSREFTTTDLTVEAGVESLKEIENEKPYPMPVRMLGAAMIAAFFSVIFGGGASDFCVALIDGVLCYTLSCFLSKYPINPFIISFCCCGVAAFIALLAATTVPGASYSSIIIGTLMIFVPGVAITNSIRDFLSGDMLSGVSRMMEAFLIAVSLASGVGFVMKIWVMLGGITL
ncbi:MAG: threonine/serine exporter family protein [Bacillota bacterium]|nr:threonine/serine exporter family protein [Bacillota bacterium]